MAKMVKREKDSDSDSGSSSSGDEWGKKSKKKGKRIKSVKEEEEREEGEVDDDEDDDLDDDEEVDEFNDGFDENLMGDEEDQARLAQMTEKEREQELFNRSEKREVLRTRYEIEKKLRLAKKKENASKDKPTKKESDAFTEASLRSNERRRNIEEKKKQKDALMGLKEQREKKKQKQQILRAADVYSSSSSDDDDDNGRKSSSSSSSSSDESDDGKKRRGSDDDAESNYVLTLEDLNKVRVKREEIEKWCHASFFNSTMMNAFVKVGIGSSKADKIPVYRVAQVVEILEVPAAYEINPKTKVKTNKVIKVKHAKDERQFRLLYVSNSDFMAQEFTVWKERMENEKLELPSRSMIEAKKRDIQTAKNHQFTEKEISEMIKNKEKFTNHITNYAMRKADLLKRKEAADENHDYETSAQIQAELEQIEDRAKNLDKQRTHSIAAISYINERNRMRNIADVEKALIEDRESDKKEEDDPFRRRKCAPQLVVHKVQKAKMFDGTVIKTEPTEHVDVKVELDISKSEIDTSIVKSEKKPSLSPTRDHNDLFDAHNFDIQIDFEIGPGLPAAANSTFSTTSSSTSGGLKPATNRRSLNLEEYKRKKGLI